MTSVFLGAAYSWQFSFASNAKPNYGLTVTAGELTIRNIRQITEYYLEHFWGKPDTDYSSLLIAHIFAMLVEDYIQT